MHGYARAPQLSRGVRRLSLGLGMDAPAVLAEIVGLLESRNVRYWLGRGRFRNFIITGALGDDASDLDFHIFREDSAPLHGLLPELAARKYEVTADAPHKLSMVRGGVAVEFVYLDLDSSTESNIRYHETVCPTRKRYLCAETVFSDRKLKICEVEVRVPENEYLSSVFGPRWRENRKGTGGVEI